MSDDLAHTLRGSWTADVHPLPDRMLRKLAGLIGTLPGDTPAVGVPDEVVPPSALSVTAFDDLAAIVGEQNVKLDKDSRLAAASGLSYLDLIRFRAGTPLAVPDAVVRPATPEDVAAVVRACARLAVAVVPFGGGTSVVGGVAPLLGDKVAVIAVDLVRLDRLVSVDPVSRVAVVQAGVRGPDVERMLAVHGLTLGHYPQSFERATIGGFAATRSAGQASSGYGRFEDMVVALRVATPRGEWRLGVSPASAAGPDLRAMVVGSEGVLGIVTEVTLRVRPAPTARRYEAYAFDGWSRGITAVRALAQHGALATVTRLSDVDETMIALAGAGGKAETALRAYLAVRGIKDPCLLVVGWEASDDATLATARWATRRVLKAQRGVPLGKAPGEAWLKGRFGGPRQRDALLDVGVCVETLETATYWSGVSSLRDAVRTALTTALPGKAVVMCHVSHAYETGASLYFTVLTRRDPADPVGQWTKAKAAASEAIAGHHRGTITHHHAVGVDHAPYLEAEIGELGVEVLRAVKHTLDPTNIMNPHKLIPDR